MPFKSKARADIAVRCVGFLISSLFNANCRVSSDRSDGAGGATAAAVEQNMILSEVRAVTKTEEICWSSLDRPIRCVLGATTQSVTTACRIALFSNRMETPTKLSLSSPPIQFLLGATSCWFSLPWLNPKHSDSKHWNVGGTKNEMISSYQPLQCSVNESTLLLSSSRLLFPPLSSHLLSSPLLFPPLLSSSGK